ncbi:hypothetical protein BC826DRAFT_988617 [Russula brevipes]|nr:hypothetical protein BC826DRAFT_988617 [Russula brevipes]
MVGVSARHCGFCSSEASLDARGPQCYELNLRQQRRHSIGQNNVQEWHERIRSITGQRFLITWGGILNCTECRIRDNIRGFGDSMPFCVPLEWEVRRQILYLEFPLGVNMTHRWHQTSTRTRGITVELIIDALARAHVAYIGSARVSGSQDWHQCPCPLPPTSAPDGL